MKVYEIKKGLRAYGNEAVRVVTNVFKEKKKEFVEYKVLYHSQKGRVGKIKTCKRESFVKWLEGVKQMKEDYRPGDILLFGEDKLQVIKNNGLSGTVKLLNEDFVVNDFYWSGCDDLECIKIGYSSI